MRWKKKSTARWWLKTWRQRQNWWMNCRVDRAQDNMEERGEPVHCLCTGQQKCWTMRLDMNTCCCSSICQRENEWKWKLCVVKDVAARWLIKLWIGGDLFWDQWSLFLLEAEIHKHLWQASVQPTALLLLEHHLRALICISTGTSTNTTRRRQAPDETAVTIATLNQKKLTGIDQTASKSSLWASFSLF